MLVLVGGDEIIEPFLLRHTDGSIVDLGGMSLTGTIWWRDAPRLELADGFGIQILDNFPSENPDDQDPHGHIILSEAQTLLFPLGRISAIRLTVVSLGVTMSSYFEEIERIQ